MDKKDILERSQKENQFSDERDRQIELNACKAGYRVVMGANVCVILLLIIQEVITGKIYFHITWWPFALTMFVSQTAHDFTYYHYYRKSQYLISALLSAATLAVVLFMLTKGY